MKKSILVLITFIISVTVFAQSNLDTVKIKLVYTGQQFETYKKRIQTCVPCYLFVSNSKDSLLYQGISTHMQNKSHHFYTLKPDSIILKQFPKINQSVISTWSKDSIHSFILGNPIIRKPY